jgi:cyclase
MDTDGVQTGFDCPLTKSVAEATTVPIIASGGAGQPEDFVEVLTTGCADAALAASVFHYGKYTVADLKNALARAAVPVRPLT